MSSLVLILAIFLRKRRSFVQRMRLMSRQMRRMRQNVVILAIQRQNNIHRRQRETMWVYPRRLENNFARLFWQASVTTPQGPEEMCLSLEHQDPSKTSEKIILIALRFRYTFYRPQTKRLRARKMGLQYKIRNGRKQIWGRFSNP